MFKQNPTLPSPLHPMLFIPDSDMPFPYSCALPIPTPNLGEGIPLPVFLFWCGEDRFLKNSTLKWFGERPRGGIKGVIPCSCNLALEGASWYLCVRGLSVSTALQERGLARGCPSRLQRCLLPAVSKIGEGFFLKSIFKREDG